MIRIVIDTNVLASATIAKAGAPGQILRAFLAGEVDLISSPFLLAELEDVLTRPHIQKRQWMTPSQIASLLAHLKSSALLASDDNAAAGSAPDPDDDYVLSAAHELRADYIVSGDSHLLDLMAYKDIPIVTPAQFMQKLS